MKYIDADLLRKEIKRLEKTAHKSALGCADSETRKFHEGKDFAYQHVGILIDSLQQEQQEEPDKSIEEAAIDFADNARKQLFTKDYAISSIADYDHGCIDGFKAGAEWQKEQILNDAVEGYANYYEDSGGILMAEAQVGCPYHNGDKVRIVVLKAEEE